MPNPPISGDMVGVGVTAGVASAVTKRTFRDMITGDAYKSQLAAALPKGFPVDRMVRVVLTAMNRTPKLLECSQTSLWQAVLDCAALGLMPDPLGRAYLVPYQDRKNNTVICQLIIGYKGLIDLMYRSERIAMIQVGAVRKGDHWVYERGMTPKLEHRPADDADGERPLTHVYSIVHLKDATMPSIEVMTRAECDRIRQRSRAGVSGPWVTDYEAMCIKTCIRKHAKILPASTERAYAEAIDGDTMDTGFTDEITKPARLADAGFGERSDAAPTAASSTSAESPLVSSTDDAKSSS